MDDEFIESTRTVLIAEDEHVIQRLLQRQLEKAGYAVRIAENGEAALATFKDGLPDLIISDVLMPVMNGYDLYKKLKANEMTAEIPILIISERGKMEDTFRSLGAEDFLRKPLNPDNLIEKVDSFLGKLKEGKRVQILKKKPDEPLSSGDTPQATFTFNQNQSGPKADIRKNILIVVILGVLLVLLVFGMRMLKARGLLGVGIRDTQEQPDILPPPSP